MTTPIVAQKLYFVNQSAPGGAQTGLSWADAFTGLHQALAAADPGDTIWVAAGVYKPTASADRTISFNLVDGVCLFGGFSGDETGLSQRQVEQNQSVLSGDIGVTGLANDNSYHVVRGKGLGSSTLLDGFFIRDGYSDNDIPPAKIDQYGAGMLLEGAAGAPDSRPVIQNCFFENNRAREGGALCATWVDFANPSQNQYPVNPVLRNCTFSRNYSISNAGAVYKNGPAVQDSFIIEDCRFFDNKAFTGQGGGIYFNAQGSSNVVLRRCIFGRDTSWANGGGGIAFPSTPPDSSAPSLLVDSCIFRENVALEGAALFLEGYLNPGTGMAFTIKIRACLFEKNLARTAEGPVFFIIEKNFNKFDIEVEKCLIIGNLSASTIMQTAISGDSYLKVNQCVFIHNRSRSNPNGVCMALNNGGGLNNVVITEVTNCLFYRNGGGVAATSSPKNYSTTKVANCTFFENNEYTFIKAWDTAFNQPNGYFNDFYIDNCIIWEPATNLRKAFYNNEPLTSNMYGYHINHTLLSLTDSVSVPGAEESFQQGNLWGVYPGFLDTMAMDFRLKVCSPAMNAGNNQIAQDFGMDTDLEGMQRIRYGRVDLGAYEQQDSCFIINTVAPPGVVPLVLWPNPAPDGSIGFTLPIDTPEPGAIQLSDSNGQELFQSIGTFYSDNRINLGELPPGFYFIRLQLNKTVFSGKWVRL